jgi:hypothetical protein
MIEIYQDINLNKSFYTQSYTELHGVIHGVEFRILEEDVDSEFNYHIVKSVSLCGNSVTLRG